MSALKTLGALVGLLAACVALAFVSGFVRVRRWEPPPPDPEQIGAGFDDDQIAGLGYIAVSATPEDLGRRGVTQRDDTRVDPDMLVLYSVLGWGPGLKDAPLTMPWREARLIDVDGEIVHRWNTDVFGEDRKGTFTARMMPDGSIVIGAPDVGVAKLDWDSRLVWKHEDVFHHDVNFDAAGNVYTMCERMIEVDYRDGPFGITDQGIAILDPEGRLVDRLWFSEMMETERLFHDQLARAWAWAEQQQQAGENARPFADVFHANAVEVLDADPHGRWEAGDLLTSLRNMHTVAVVSRKRHKIILKWGRGALDQQHSPTALPNGDILVFDNGPHRRWSRVVEFSPREREIVWEYRGTTTDPFFSATRGVVQGIEGDRVMVFSSNRGRIFEIDREGHIVWEYFSGEHYGSRTVPIRGQRLQGAALVEARRRLGSIAPSPR